MNGEWFASTDYKETIHILYPLYLAHHTSVLQHGNLLYFCSRIMLERNDLRDFDILFRSGSMEVSAVVYRHCKVNIIMKRHATQDK